MLTCWFTLYHHIIWSSPVQINKHPKNMNTRNIWGGSLRGNLISWGVWWFDVRLNKAAVTWKLQWIILKKNLSVWSWECSVALAPAHRGVGASTASLWLALTRLTPFWKTAVWRHNLSLVVVRRYLEIKTDKKKTTKKQNTARVLTHTSSAGGSLFLPPQQPASVSVRFGVLRFCPTARKT